ncbi:ChaC-like protein [Kockovaella imperatae]|uniref:glutathione-specific gamma-glutamylcyclotransferase n=1 Tax=Kockovaella imperatae TaxID=4999 RepID=A0A1Y1UA70_9TREE|nr:ChaC-like protein [Kockovaella imperatae]ORX34930.1 ChaC-like protein [Kockovaella imperatae]
MSRPYWVFGYGSLIWKPPPHAIEQKSGYVKGVVRRFAQSSIDHRGTPEAPGRVVTVIQAADWHTLAGTSSDVQDEDFVWGVAYRIDPEKEVEVRAYLEHREQNGYTPHDVKVYSVTDDRETVVVDQAVIWIGQLSNPAFVGYEDPQTVASMIARRSGPSGPNKEYLFNLAHAVRELYPHVKDDYLFDLEARVRALEPR